MFSKTLLAATSVIFSLLILSCQQDEHPAAQLTAALEAGTDECYRCNDIMTGSYFFDGNEIWVPNEGQLPLQPGNPYFSISDDWDAMTITFSSDEFRFCKKPPKVWTYAHPAYQDLWPYECLPDIGSVELSADNKTLTLHVDYGFLVCAFESNMAGFKFAIPITN